MFAVVGQKLGETENIYETIESYTCEIEKELLHTLNKMQIEPKPRPPVKRINRAAPKPIVIYEEPMSESQQQDDPYVVAIREDPDNTYETIGTVLSSEMDSLPRLPHQDNRPRHVNSELNRKGAVDCGNRPIMRPGLSSNNLDNHDVHDHLLKIRPGNLEVPGQPVSCKGCYQTRMEAVARKVSLLKGRGQLKLSVYVNCGLLTIHVVQARHLGSKATLNCNTYVRLSLAPDETRRTKCKTALVSESNNPFYDEKFSFELLDEDFKKRLLISLWNRDGKGRSEFLGCMSFGINHIQKSRRTVNGWYYLLTEEVGRRKHLRVVDKRSSGSLSERPAKNRSPARDDAIWMDQHIVVVRRTGTGFGFTVTGSAPVRICKVESRSPADAAGLRKDDCIVRINGHNVARSSSDSVARLVRHSQRQIVLEIQRARALDVLISSPWKPALCSTFLSSSSDSEEDEGMGTISFRDSLRSYSPPPLRLEDLESSVRPPRRMMGSGGSTSSARSSTSGRYFRESLV